MIHSLLINRKRIIEVGMTEGSEEQDLLKALDGVADAAASVGGVPSPLDSNTESSALTQPEPGVSGAVDSPFPPLVPSAEPTEQSVSPSTAVNVPTPGPLMTDNEASADTATSTDSFDMDASTTEPFSSFTPSTPDFTASKDNAVSDVSMSFSPNAESDQAPLSADMGPLASIKKDVLVELRPLVDKLNISPEEKFDTLLLLIRSTDDSSLIESAHEAAKGITDESRRAEALFEIVKEIDYLTHKQTEAA